MFQINDRKNLPRSTGRWNLTLRIILSALIAGVVWLRIPATTAHGFQVCANSASTRLCALGDTACAVAVAAAVAAVAACEVKIHAYNIYMAQMGAGVTKHQLPAIYREILGPRYSNLSTFRFGFSDRQPPSNATTDCNTTYFSDPVYVDKLQKATANLNYRWLLHELTHTDQCSGNREAYAKRWWDEMEAAGQGSNINFAQSPENVANQITFQVHDSMPMEQQATNKANTVFKGLLTCCIDGDGKLIRPMTVSGIDERLDAGTLRRILTARVANGDGPFTTKWWIKSPGDSRFIEQPQNLVNGLELLWTPRNDPAKPEVNDPKPKFVGTEFPTRLRWQHDIEVEITQRSAGLEKGKATRTIVISEPVSIIKGPKVPKLPAELPPSKISELPHIGPGTAKQPGGPIPPKPPIGPGTAKQPGGPIPPKPPVGP